MCGFFLQVFEKKVLFTCLPKFWPERRPGPPIRPHATFETMLPYKLVMIITSNCSGLRGRGVKLVLGLWWVGNVAASLTWPPSACSSYQWSCCSAQCEDTLCRPRGRSPRTDRQIISCAGMQWMLQWNHFWSRWMLLTWCWLCARRSPSSFQVSWPGRTRSEPVAQSFPLLQSWGFPRLLERSTGQKKS